MKKRLIILLVALAVFIIPTSASSRFTLEGVNYPVIVNGQQLKTNSPLMIYNDSVTYAPLRAICEQAGLKVRMENGQAVVKSNPEEYVKNKMTLECVKVEASASGSDNYMTGSGVCYKGYIVTCYHVVKGYSTFNITFDYSVMDTVQKATLVKYDENLDIAILKPDFDMKSSTILGDSSKIDPVKNDLVVISSPKGVINVASFAYTEFIKDDQIGISAAKVYPGSSGGALFNEKAELVGIIQANKDIEEKGSGCIIQKKYSYAIPINKIKPLLNNLN